MFIQRNNAAKTLKVVLLVLLFAIISVIAPFSAYKLSAGVVAADESKVEYTLSDFIDVPDDGLDFNSETYNENNKLPLNNSYSASVLDFSFALQLNEELVTAKKSVYFGISNNYFIKFEFNSQEFSASLNNGEKLVSKFNSKTLANCLAGCGSVDLIVFKISVVAKNSIALQVECGDNVGKATVNFDSTIRKLFMYCNGLKSAKLYDSDKKIEKVGITVKNEGGEVISPVDSKTLSQEDIVKTVETDQRRFIGFEYGGKLYQTAKEIENADKNAVVIAKTMTLYTENGACIRTVEPYGIRFAAVADCPDAGSSAYDYIVDYGIMLTTKDIAKDSGSFTLENLTNSKSNVKIARKSSSDFKEISDESRGISRFAITLTDIRKENYNLVFASRAFSEIKYADGATKIIYSDFSDNNCRSVYEVARNGLENFDFEAYYDIFKGYCDGVIDITSNGENASVGYKSDKYSVDVKVDEVGITVIFNDVAEGFAVKDNVKCITVNGKRIVGFEYSGGKIEIAASKF